MRVALVTGGTRGIGLAIASRLASEGFALAVCGRRAPDEVGGVVETLEAAGTSAGQGGNAGRTASASVLYVQADVSERPARDRLMRAVEERFGRLDVLVNNAGMAPRRRTDLLEATEESFEEVMKANLQGPFFLTQACARWMVQQRSAEPDFSGCIVNISSMSATVASTDRGEYCVSKAGVAMATKLWAARLGEWGIPVYEVRPGVVRTDMTATVEDKYDRLIENGLTIERRWGAADDVGRAVAALVRGDFAYATGNVVHIDGGLTVPRL